MSTISNVSGTSSIALQMLQHSRRKPDTSELAKELFSKLDTSSKGYIEKSDLESALSEASSTSSSSKADEMFSALDSDSDGKVTQAEVQSTLQKIADQMDEQFNSMRVQAGMQGMGGTAGVGGTPPAPPEDDEGFTKDELSAQLEEIGSSDSKRSDLINNIVSNFDKADTDGDGKVSFKEAMAYDKSQNGDSSSSTSSDSTTTTTTAASTTDASANIKLMHQIMDLMRMYSSSSGSAGASSVSTSV